MRPLALVSAGLVLVAVDLRVDRFDLLADPIGWLLVAEGARRLALRAPMWAAYLAAALSAAEVWLPHHLQLIDADTGEPVRPGVGARRVTEHLVFDRVTGLQLLALVLGVVVGGIAVWLLLRALAARASGDERRRLDVLRWAAPVVWAGPVVVVAAVQHDGFDPVWNGAGEELLGLACVVALGLVALQLLSCSGRRWALPPATPLRNL